MLNCPALFLPVSNSTFLDIAYDDKWNFDSDQITSLCNSKDIDLALTKFHKN